jgi:predicted deacetylase
MNPDASTPKPKAWLVVSLHDVHPGSLSRIRAQRKTLEMLGVTKFSLLAVPWWHGGITLDSARECSEWLRRRADAGDAVVQHGWRHDCRDLPAGKGEWFWRNLYTSNECEFLSLTREQAAQRIEAGRKVFAAAGLGVAKGFIAPAWLLGSAAREAVTRAGFRYTVGVDTINALDGSGRTWGGRSLCWSARSWWRRLLSVPWNQALLRKRLAAVSRNAVGEPEVVRVSLHPSDFQHAALRSNILNTVSACLSAGCVPVTYDEVVASSGK